MPAPRNEHPDCAAISVPDKDPVYSKDRIRCINYVRSLPVIRQDCHFGPVEQVICQKISSFAIRHFSHDKIKYSKRMLLPTSFIITIAYINFIDNEFDAKKIASFSFLSTNTNCFPSGVTMKLVFESSTDKCLESRLSLLNRALGDANFYLLQNYLCLNCSTVCACGTWS